VLLARHVVAGYLGGPRGLREATEALVTGPLAWQFWTRVVGGLLVPLLLLLIPATRTVRGMAVAGALSLGGVLLDRLMFVSAGQVAPITTQAGTVSSPYAAYVPSIVEITIIVGAGAFVAFAYTLAERYLDLREADVHFGFPLDGLRRRFARRAIALPVDAPAEAAATATEGVAE
jgi:Ni/Fe-hydrogenase subunit HybB-like protein